MTDYDVCVIGAGPAGLAAALAAHEKGKRVLLIERAARMGGILNQCIHDGFGLLRFGQRLSGCEYANRYVRMVEEAGIPVSLLTFVTHIEKEAGLFRLTLVSAKGVSTVSTAALVLSTGCRERTAKQVGIHGTRPAGVFTAGTAQYYMNIMGQLPAKRCVILGSGDIGLIMARRLTLEGAEVLGVYEAKPTPSGLTRNIAQCLDDFNIPLHVSHTVTRVFGESRLEAVEVSRVDEKMQPISGTEQLIPCDALILSVGLIPENELAESINVELDPKTKGPVCDQNYQTLQDGVFVCGNALHVNDLVDYVSESGAAAGAAAADYVPRQRSLAVLQSGKELLYAVPERIDLSSDASKTAVFFRSRQERGKTRLDVFCGGKSIFSKTYSHLKPPEMERVELDLSAVKENDTLEIQLSEVV